jgi:hypothetical protein
MKELQIIAIFTVTLKNHFVRATITGSCNESYVLEKCKELKMLETESLRDLKKAVPGK